MFVVKRDGRRTPMLFDKITSRNKVLANNLKLTQVNIEQLSQNVIRSLTNNMTTHEIDNLSCEQAIAKSIINPEYGTLALHIGLDDLYKRTPSSLKECLTILYNNKNNKKEHYPLIEKNIYEFAMENINILEKEIDHKYDSCLSYASLKILEASYLLKSKNKVIERPQYMFMRVALGIYGPSNRNGIKLEGNIEEVLNTYKLFRYATHATPTLFNSGTIKPQDSSCFLLSMPDSMNDNPYDENNCHIENISNEASIPNTIRHMSIISKHAGGIGIDFSRVRCRGSSIASSGRSLGTTPMNVLLNYLSKFVNQSGKRNGAISVYLDLSHPDIPEFLKLKLNTTPNDISARDLFLALWTPDLFFQRLKNLNENPDEMWSFFDPHSHPDLPLLYGEEYTKKYIQLENEKKYVSRMKVSELFEMIFKSLDETGVPYMLSKDNTNKCSNHRLLKFNENGQLVNLSELYKDKINEENIEKILDELKDIGLLRNENTFEIRYLHSHPTFTELKIGIFSRNSLIQALNDKIISRNTVVKWLNEYITRTITSSNLCAEIVQYHNPNSIATCNLASIQLPKFIIDDKYDFNKLAEITSQLIKNINRIIDINYYPVRETLENNLRFRPMGIGVQGGADVYQHFSISWENPLLAFFNKIVGQVMYYNALKSSNELAKTQGVYPEFWGSPLSYGIFHFETFGITVNDLETNISTPSFSIFNTQVPKYDWEELRQSIKKYGVRNSLFLAMMPTATTSYIFENSESLEPKSSNVFMRKTTAGNIPIINKYLYRDLKNKNLWNKYNINCLRRDNGSVLNMDIPKELKDIYKTSWEIPQKYVLEAYKAFAPFIDQTMSMNIRYANPDISKIRALYLAAHGYGLKTLSYYLRSKEKSEPIKFDIDLSENLETETEIKTETETEIKTETETEIKTETKNSKENIEYFCNDDVCIACSS
jgi:ribonucleotide reductase alpha subunit